MDDEENKIWLREWRLYAGLSVAQVAEATGRSEKAVEAIENGTADYNGKYLRAFAEAVGAPHFADVLTLQPGVPIPPELARLRRAMKMGLKVKG